MITFAKLADAVRKSYAKAVEDCERFDGYPNCEGCSELSEDDFPKDRADAANYASCVYQGLGISGEWGAAGVENIHNNDYSNPVLCEYCGSRIFESDRNCPTCGAPAPKEDAGFMESVCSGTTAVYSQRGWKHTGFHEGGTGS